MLCRTLCNDVHHHKSPYMTYVNINQWYTLHAHQLASFHCVACLMNQL